MGHGVGSSGRFFTRRAKRHATCVPPGPHGTALRLRLDRRARPWHRARVQVRVAKENAPADGRAPGSLGKRRRRRPERRAALRRANGAASSAKTVAAHRRLIGRRHATCMACSVRPGAAAFPSPPPHAGAPGAALMSFASIDWQALFVPAMPLEMVVRGTVSYWFLFVLFRFAVRRRIGAVGMADILILVIVS